LHETIGPADVLWIIEERFRIEIADLTRNLAIVLTNVEGSDSADAAFPLRQSSPKRFEIVANWGDNADPCNYDSAIIHKK
jgi:hypothetical protein